MKVIHTLRMDLARCGCRPVVAAVQGEANTRVLEVSLYDNGVAWEIPAEAVVDVAYQKPDGTQGIYSRLPDGSPATSFSGNVLSATLAPQMLTCAGPVLATFVFSKDGEKTLAAFPFTITVTANPAAGAERSEDYFNPKDLSDLRAEFMAALMAHADRHDNPHGVTAAQVGARPNTWLPTIADIGAAPAGYGLGANGATAATAYTEVGKVLADALDTTGIYWFADNEYANRIGNSDRGILVHYQHSLYNTVAAEQIFYPAYNCNSGHLERKKLSGTDYWQPWDWVDPPMSVDVEYRTTERWYGRPVFTQLVDCMFGPNKTITETQIKVPEGTAFERAIFCSVHGANSSIVLPVMGFDVTNDFGCAGIIGDRVRISTNVDGSGIHYYATVKYLKQGV